MSALSTLTFSDTRRNANAAPSELRNRARALEIIDQQIALAKDPDARAMRVVGKRDERKEVERRNGGRMFWCSPIGWHVEFRFAGSLVDFSDNGGNFTTIDAGKEREGVVRVFEVLRESVRNGELDDRLSALIARRKRRGQNTDTQTSTSADLDTTTIAQIAAEPQAPEIEPKTRRSRGH